MCVSDLAANDNPSDERLQRLVNLSRAEKNGLVSVAGPRGLDALGLLCRHDFERVQCARQATCCGADDESDVLLIAGLLDDQDRALHLERTLRLLRDGGVLAIELSHLDDDCRVQRKLVALGFEVTSTVFDLSHEVMVAHTLCRRADLQQAA